jgi:hypothetical protein
MKPALTPRHLISLILFLVCAAFFTGSLRLFHGVHAAALSQAMTSFNDQAVTSAGLILKPASIITEAANKQTPVPTGNTPPATPVSADTTGIIALAIVIVATILVGAAWGVRGSPQKKKFPK